MLRRANGGNAVACLKRRSRHIAIYRVTADGEKRHRRGCLQEKPGPQPE
jgi:hypothetical protein